MHNKKKQGTRPNNLVYFFRYFMIFTLIFTSMTLIIFQVMRSTMYRDVDVNFQEFIKHPEEVIAFELEREKMIAVETRVEIDRETNTVIESKKQYGLSKLGKQFRFNSNYHIVLYDEDGEIINNIDLPTKWIAYEFHSSVEEKPVEQTVETIFGDSESYRMMKVDVANHPAIAKLGLDIDCAALLVNTTQIRDSIFHYEQIVLWVMFLFWLISTGASLYLAKLSMKPLLLSMQKEKEFVENASHELRTPLSVLQNRLESLFRKPDATIIESSENIASSLEEVRNMRLLTHQLLHLARHDEGVQPTISTIAPSFFETTMESFALVAKENNRHLEVNQAIKKPILSDKVLLKQLMTILFDNAVKYTSESGRIWIHIEEKNRSFYFRMMDDGPGISDADKLKIFDRFYRVDKARTRQNGGFGLGLSLAKQIVDGLSGQITVHDREPKGTIFEVKLPL